MLNLRTTALAMSVALAAALPVTLRSVEERLGVKRSIAQFTMPLCTTVNMNACAAFILITFFFVSTSYGLSFTLDEQIVWIFIATIAAFGNAAVPMGCYFLATSFLAAMDVPLYMMGAILPFYQLIDMLESAINVWSDACITQVVDRDMESLPIPAAAVATG